MGKSLDQLGLKEEALPTAGQTLDDLPEFGGWEPPPQPGAFRFRLPADLSAIYDVYDTPQLTPPQRVKAIFDRDHPLVIVQSTNPQYVGQPFQTRWTNQERGRGKDKSVTASDWDYVLRALGEKAKPTSNKGYIDALKRHAGKEFSADLRYSWRCSKDRNIRVPSPTPGGPPVEVEGQKGCGEAYYQEDVPRNADGTVPYEISCQCGAQIRAFANLDNIRS